MTNPTPVQLSDEKLAEIAKGCEGVTPGPWGEGDKWVFASPRSGNPSHALEHIFRNEEAQANAEHVARLDPQTVLSLVTELQHSRAEEAVGDQRDLDITILLANIDSLMEVAGDLDPEDKAVIEQIRASSDARFIGRPSPASPSATGVRVTDAQVEKAAREFLLHKGETPWRVTRRGAELWEDYAPAMRASLEAALGQP